MSTAPLLDVKDLEQRYTLPRESLFRPPGQVRALNGVSVRVDAGKSLGIVGESGSGKSTFARLVMALERPTSGQVALLGRDLNRISADELRRARRDFQMVFQDPYGSLDPRQTIARIVAEPLTVLEDADRRTFHARVAAVLRQVGLRDADMEKYPHEFSGGQRQRIAIARALITQPKLIVADEPVFRAGRLRAGAGLEPDAGSPGAVRPELRPDQPRPRRRRLSLRRGRGDVSRPDRRAGPSRGFVRALCPSLYTSIAGCRASGARRRWPAPARSPGDRLAIGGRERMSLCHPLCARRPALPRGSA
ncbi:ABC-type dipeptide/oligopeptide/nickel transport system ATPase subunit [Bradyrhizobium sp. LB1.3]